jgi:hypothetical protein
LGGHSHPSGRCPLGRSHFTLPWGPSDDEQGRLLAAAAAAAIGRIAVLAAASATAVVVAHQALDLEQAGGLSRAEHKLLGAVPTWMQYCTQRNKSIQRNAMNINTAHYNG